LAAGSHRRSRSVWLEELFSPAKRIRAVRKQSLRAYEEYIKRIVTAYERRFSYLAENTSLLYSGVCLVSLPNRETPELQGLGKWYWVPGRSMMEWRGDKGNVL